MSRSSGRSVSAPISMAVALALASAALAAGAHAAQVSGDTRNGGTGQQAPARHKAAAPGAASAKGRQPSGSLQQIVISGIVGSIENSLEAQKLSNEVVEVVSAEDIGKLPDPSIAESLARLPGVLAERGGDGFSNNISIRGLSPDFVGTLVNGRVQATTGENWGVDFNQIPAELVSGAKVYLTPNAELIGQGLSGTIDVHTINPLAYGKRRLTVTAQGNYLTHPDLNRGEGVGRMGEQLSATYIDQFLDHTLGVAVGVAHSDTPIEEQTYQNWWWSMDNGPGSIEANWGGGHTPGMPDNVISQEGMQIRANSALWSRDALMGIVDWAPSSGYHTKLNLFYSTMGQDRYINGLQWTSQPWGGGAAYSNVGTIPGQPYPLANSGTLLAVKPIMQNEYTHYRYDLMSVGWTNAIRLEGGWRVNTDLSYSRATESLHDAYAFTGLAGGGTLSSGFALGSGWGFGSFSPSVNLANPADVAFTDPDNYGYDGRAEYDYQVDRIGAVKFDVAHAVGWIFSDAHLGFYYSDRRKTKHAQVYFAFLNGNGSGPGTYQNGFSAPIGQGSLLPPTSLAYAGVGNIINYNVLGALASQFQLVAENEQGDWDRNYTVQLKTPTAYAMLDIDTRIGGVPLRGNVGAQFVHTEQSSQALQTTGNGVAGSLNGGINYNEFLPSLNLVARLPDENYLRLGVAKEMVYGRIDDIRASASAGIGQITSGPLSGQVLWSGSGGNPRLRPYVAVGIDLAWTKYFGRATFIELDAFNKKLLNYIYNQTLLNYNFSGYTNTNPTLVPTSNIGTFTQPENGSGGRLYGGTVAGGLDFGKLSRFLKGFGTQVNFTRINSNIPKSTLSQIPGAPQTLPGLSRNSGSLTVYYERGGLSVRLAEIYRSSYTGEAVGLFDQLGYTEVLAYKEADFQTEYDFKNGRFKGLTLLVDVSNLTNAPYRTLQVTSLPNGVMFPSPLEFDTWGRTISVGFRYSLW